jgi:hypothetical protein
MIYTLYNPKRMTIKIYQEKDKTYGARIQIGKNILYAIGDTFDELQQDIEHAMTCAFDDQTPRQKHINENVLQMLYSPVHHAA